MAKSPENNSYDSGDESYRESSPSSQDREHSRIARLVKTAGQNLPDVDSAFLEKLEQETTKAFLASHQGDEHRVDQTADPFTRKEPKKLETSPASSTRGKNNMTTFLTRALAATLAGVIAWFGWSMTRNDHTLGAALDRTVAHSLKLQLTNANLSYDIFTAPGKIRVNSAVNQYQIGNNEQTWMIDESKNRIQTGPPRYYDADGKLNLLSLLGDIPSQEFTALRNLKPAGESVLFNGFQCRRYESPINCAPI